MNTTEISLKQDRSASTDLMRTYLQEIGRFPLLTHEQEILLGKRVQRMMSCLEKKENLEKKLGLEPSLKQWANAVDLTTDELNQVLRQGQQAKKKMIEANLRLVVSIRQACQSSWAPKNTRDAMLNFSANRVNICWTCLL